MRCQVTSSTNLHSKTGSAAGRQCTCVQHLSKRRQRGDRYLDGQGECLARVHSIEEGAQAPHVGLLGVVKLAGIWLQRQSLGMSGWTKQPADGSRQS